MRELLRAQSENSFLWVPLLMAGGAATYFSMPFEPALPAPVVISAVLCAVAIFRRTPIALRALALFVFGMFYACAFTRIIATPILPRTMIDATVTGRVTMIDYTPDKARIYLKLNGDELGAPDRGATVRVSVSRDDNTPHVGDTIRAKVNLYRTSGADAPGAFDYARWAYFNGIGATGYMSEFDVIQPARHTGITAIRDQVHRGADSFLTDALVLGYKNTLDKDTRAVWTATGIAHVWSISGFHITLVGGWLFAIFFLIFRAIPFVTRRIPARKPATICAWIFLTGFLAISGMGVATVRAFLMASLIFTALLIGRRATSLRNVAIAFCVIFLMNPHSIMQAGFQLSFAAIFGLVWFWENFKFLPRVAAPRIAYASTMTCIVATIFTTPFIATHFHSLPTYGMLGNLILLPIFSMAIMPLTLMGTICAMTGWHAPLSLAHSIYDFAFKIATWISQLPHANIAMGDIPNTAIILTVMGFASLMFIKPVRAKINYAAAAVFIGAGITVAALAPRPVFYSTSDNELIAFRDGDNLAFNKSRSSKHFFAFDTWKEINREPTGTPNPRRASHKGLWEITTPEFRLVYIQKYVPLAENIVRLCGPDAPDYIVSYFKIDAPNCNAKILRGGFAIYPSGRVRHVNNRRIWHGVNNRN